ncbi:cell migration-inducing and hyaluronan-binding protein [Altererythrobacter atlanticus]|uniref:G8 domain protein n=1 Tax=Croceibacterium atlanticum TaxID=1267766 RepID=A0A0F7KVG3_9SPHN|nr:G8 domain-containing protein [Croceibacterium atlanticum]AKH44323.1 G8 domain protein [Croceibacterium atlanticum]MBB5733894.1 cell migration-inducing and hyaluronan-binding protein [Croceibacterium atlanticum]
MREQTRLYRLCALLPVSLLCGTGTALAAQDQHAHTPVDAGAAPTETKSVRWSDPAAWPDGKVPGEGDAVTIPRGMDVLLDVSPPALRSLTVNGKLRFSDERDLELVSDWIYVPGGELEIGTEDRPHRRKATITLTDNVPGEDINTMGDRGIILLNGTLNLHGDRENSWTKLARTAEAGATSIEVLDANGWRKGDEIILASTDFNPRQAEKRVVTAIDGNRITLDRPLEYMHFGEITFGVDERGEVGLLTRNIRIQASEDSQETYFGGHIMAMAGSEMYIDSVELTRMGQHLTLARYPVHWHLIGEGAGQYVRNSSIHDTFSRCVTVHGTNNLLVEGNVTYNTVGHCFFMEDGIETGNQFVRNLGIQTKCHPTLPCEPTNLFLAHQSTEGQKSEHILIPSDNTVSTFWITNPDNIYRDNVAAGSDQIGFWMAFPTHPTGQFEGTEISANTWPGRMQLREFKGNVAHSNFDGLMLDRGPAPDGTFGIAGPNLTSREDPADPASPVVMAVFEDFTGYKNRNGAIWGRGEYHLYKGLKLADNAIGFTHATSSPGIAPFTSRVVDSLFVGESDNIGNPTTPEEIAYGRSLPSAAPDFPIRGYEYYDFHHEVENTRFVNFMPNQQRDAGALSYLLFTSFGMSTENSVKGLSFENAQPVSFPPIQRRWASDYGRSAAYKSAAFRDLDGSVTGIPGAHVVIDNGIASDEESCEIKASWNAAICDGDIGRFSISGNFNGFETGPIAEPIILQRNGKRFEYIGETTIGSGAELRVETGRETLSLALREMDEGAFVLFELPGFTTSAGGRQEDSLDALRAADSTAYFKDGDTLWVKLVVEDAAADGPVIEKVGNLTAQASIEVGRDRLGG